MTLYLSTTPFDICYVSKNLLTMIIEVNLDEFTDSFRSIGGHFDDIKFTVDNPNDINNLLQIFNIQTELNVTGYNMYEEELQCGDVIMLMISPEPNEIRYFIITIKDTGRCKNNNDQQI